MEIETKLKMINGVEIMAVCEDTGKRPSSPKEIYAFMAEYADMSQEGFFVITLNTKSVVIGKHLVFLGSANTCPVSSREIFRRALLDGAVGVILCHNHPSGDPSPSSQDIAITRKLIEGGKVLDIQVLDHVILGRKGEGGSDAFISLRECGLLDFNSK